MGNVDGQASISERGHDALVNRPCTWLARGAPPVDGTLT
jgi:hypothetical protein